MLYLDDEPGHRSAARVQAAAAAAEQALGALLVDLVPSYASLLVLFDPLKASHVDVLQRLRAALAALDTGEAPAGELVTLPVYYAPEAGPDLVPLAEAAGLTTEEVIALHTAPDYRVYAIGFAPGFAYLGEVDERIATPRRATPRPRVPAGSVAIADRQTAVYPAESPGGWNLLGLCPVPLFTPGIDPPMPVRVGDRVRFEPVSHADFIALGGELP